MMESGAADFDLTNWYGLFAPAGTPKEIVDKISGEMARILATSDVVERLVNQGLEPLISTPEQFAALLKDEIMRWNRIVKESGAKLD